MERAKYDYSKTARLAELRRQAGLKQDQAGEHLGLTGVKRRDTVSNYELGNSRPGPARRARFILYLLDTLRLRNRPREFSKIWSEVMEGQWGWSPLTDDEQRQHFGPGLPTRGPSSSSPPVPKPHPPSPFLPQPHSQHLNQALSALIVMMQDPRVRNDVAAFGADFESARHHAGNLIDWKYLHDRLHELEFRCYTPISMEAGRFPEHDAVTEMLSHYEFCLQEIADDLRKFAERPDCEMAEFSWVEQVFLAQDSLTGAISNLDANLLKEALRRLRRVLTTQPTRINARLSAAAESLRLSTLVKDMELLSEGLASLESEPERLARFKAGVGALASLERSMTTTVKEHNQWQRLDLDLRRIEAVMDIDTEELEASWPELKALSETLHHDRNEQWATRFRESIDRLDCAIASRNPRLTRQRFREFCREASHRFYRVDRALKKQCDDLGKVGEPLTAVLEMLK